jgi:hypothetical protein
MQRRDFLRVAPIALAGATVLPRNTTAGIPHWDFNMEYEEVKLGEPPCCTSVIRVELTPVGPLPVMEMMGEHLLNSEVFFADLEWMPDEHGLSVKKAMGFLKKEHAMSKPCNTELYYGVVSLTLWKSRAQGSIWAEVRPTSHSTSHPVVDMVPTYNRKFCDVARAFGGL